MKNSEKYQYKRIVVETTDCSREARNVLCLSACFYLKHSASHNLCDAHLYQKYLFHGWLEHLWLEKMSQIHAV